MARRPGDLLVVGVTVPARRPEDDALDRLHVCIVKLSGYEQGPEPWLSPQGQADIATVREVLERLREERDALVEALTAIRYCAEWYRKGERLTLEVHHALVVEVYAVADMALTKDSQ